MQVALGSDHGGYELKKALVRHLEGRGTAILDVGTESPDSCDYPDYAFAVAEAVASGRADFGVLICKSGIGMSIAANKVKGVYAALCRDVEDARSARMHNHANVMTLSGLRTPPQLAEEMLDAFLSTEPEGGRHDRRVGKIAAWEREHFR